MPPPGTAVGYATFPGIDRIVAVTATLAHGITPSTFQLTIAPQVISNRNIVGDLTLYYNTDRLTFRDCKINLATLVTNSSGQVIELELFDRRWKWAWGAMEGWYNVRVPAESDNIKESTKKTPQQLAQLCLQSLDESRYDLGGLSGATDYPAIDWDGPTPAQALAELAERYNARVILTARDRVALVKVGVGAALPTTLAMDATLTADIPEAPSAIEVRCGKTRYQGDFRLEAVGLDTDGSIKLIDQLTYRPSAGWETADWPYLASITNDRNRELAKRTVFRWYRVKVPLTIPGFEGQVTDRDYLELESEQVDTITVAGVKQNKPADVWGTWCPGSDTLQNVIGTTQPPSGNGSALATSGYYRQFSINAQLNIVDFGDMIFKSVNNGTPLRYAAAELYLRTAVRVRERSTGKWSRYRSSRPLNRTSQTAPRGIHHDELVLCYSGGNTANKQEIDRACRYYLDAAVTEYEASIPQQMRYIGLLAIDIDGAIQQVTWHVGPDGVWTSASRNSEHAHNIIPYKERRAWEKLGPIANQSRVGTLPSSVVKFLGAQS